MFSKSCEYAIRATIFIATQSQSNANIGIKEIAKEIDSPIAFTAKILQVLVKNNILKSTKGVGGGFMILKNDLKNLGKIKKKLLLKSVRLEKYEKSKGKNLGEDRGILEKFSKNWK